MDDLIIGSRNGPEAGWTEQDRARVTEVVIVLFDTPWSLFDFGDTEALVQSLTVPSVAVLDLLPDFRLEPPAWRACGAGGKIPYRSPSGLRSYEARLPKNRPWRK